MANFRKDYGGIQRQAMKQWLLYGIILMLSLYIALDLSIHHGNPPLFPYCTCNCRTAIANLAQETLKPDLCATRDGHYQLTSDSASKEKDPWKQMKWVGEAAQCRVKSQLIEKLDDENNFRRGFALKFTSDVEDKTHILPWILGSRMDLNARGRRVYLDLGANRFASSVKWFLRMYPCDFTEIHAFEVNPKQWRPPKTGFDEGLNLLKGPRSNPIRVNSTPSVPKWMMERVRVYYRLVSDRDDPDSNSIDITRFIKEELKLTAMDTVVIKMDIEGAEWAILRKWMDDPEMPHIVDELFVEVHYGHPTMGIYGWENFAPITRDDASRLISDLRWHGFYAHFWP
eukprot:Gb_26060 [translate_table: standard]